MAQRRKLQVFVSSTYTDLKEERQAAVEAILTAGHIPAGMELFAAGDKSQMSVIERWIDESDIYLLLLGGRYGSIEPDSGKSYTHLEYEYALQSGKAMFAVVIDEKFLKQKVRDKGIEVWEEDNPQKLKNFRSVVTGKLVKFWADLRDIKLAIMQTLSEFDRRPELIGWIPGSEATNSGAIAEEIARLTKENADLRLKLSEFSKPLNSTLYHGLTFEEMYRVINESEVEEGGLSEEHSFLLKTTAKVFEDPKISLLHVFWVMNFSHLNEQRYFESLPELYKKSVPKLSSFGMLDSTLQQYSNKEMVELTNDGYKFLLRLRVERNVNELNKKILEYYKD